MSKITSNLETPMELSIKEWCSKTCPHANPTYHLFGIVMHSGMTSCSGHYQAYVKVPVCSVMDINNNSSSNETLPFSNDRNTQSVNQISDNSNTFRKCVDVESSKEVQSQNCLNTTTELFTHNTFSSGDILVESNQRSPLAVGQHGVSQTPESSAEKAKTTCISGISRYFHRSRKDSTKEDKARCEDNGIKHGESSKGFGMQNNQNQQIPNCTETEHSLRKIQSFKYHGSKYNNSAIRQLKFHDGEPVAVGLKPRNCQDRTSHCVGEELSPSTTSTAETFQWIHFDDAEVQILEESDLRTLLSSSESAFTSPYLLFYKLVEL